ncbi:acyl-CoA thioesterase [Myxococcota bacterium]|nr:acyl-CoA thioesterase [Myxococcota bacterium]
MRHTKKMRVRFGHSDPARIVYYPRFFEWFHDIFESMFEEVFGMHYASILNERRVGFPAVQVACEFHKPATFGELVDLEVFLSRVSDKSATFEYRVRRDGQLLVSASVKVAAMDLERHQSTSIPADIKAAFAPYIEEDSERPRTEKIR